MFKIKTISRTASALLLTSITATTFISQSAAADGDVFQWRLQSHLPTGGASWQDSVVAVRDKLYERTDGRLDIELHSADSLFGGGEIFPAVSRGVIEIGHTSPAYIMDYVSTAALSWGPSAFQEPWEASYFWKQAGFEDIIREEVSNDHNMYYFTDVLYFTQMLLKEPVESLDHFGSLRIRSAGMLQSFLSDVGAAATFIPGPEIYQALSSGAVDGAHWGAAQEANALSLYEAAKYHVTSSLGIANEIFVINEDAMHALPEDIQKIVKDTLEEHFWYRTSQYQYKEVKLLGQLAEEKGVEVIDLPQEVQNRMVEISQEYWRKEADKSEYAARAVEKLEDYLKVLGYID